jgi:hypothetical protein
VAGVRVKIGAYADHRLAKSDLSKAIKPCCRQTMVILLRGSEDSKDDASGSMSKYRG